MHKLKRVVSIDKSRIGNNLYGMHNYLVNKSLCAEIVGLHMSCRNYFIGHSSSSVPRNMCHLTLRDSDDVIDEIATAYVNMNLASVKQFQQLAVSHMMRNSTQKDSPSEKIKNTKVEKKRDTVMTCSNMQYEQMMLDTLNKENNHVFSSDYTNSIKCATNISTDQVIIGAAAIPFANSDNANNDNSNSQSSASANVNKTKVAAAKNTFDVTLESFPPEAKIKLIKELRSVLQLPLQEAKTRIEKPCPHILAANVHKEDAEKLQKALQNHGAKIQLV